MGLTIDRNDPAGRERRAMGGQNKISTARIYRAIDGTLVGENDPRAARLAYAIGTEVPAEKVAEYDAFMSEADDAEIAPAGKVEDRAALRERVAPSGSGPATYTQPIGEKLATELADEAQDIANSSTETRVAAAREADDSRVVAAVRVGRTEDGELVAAEDPRSTNLMYAEGDEIVDPAHKRAYRSIAAKADEAEDEDEESDVDEEKDGDVAKPATPETPTIGAKAAKAPANKSGDQGANKSNQ